jgi:hypothetical protein
MSFSVNADIFKCPVAGVIYYQSRPCNTNSGQAIIKMNKANKTYIPTVEEQKVINDDYMKYLELVKRESKRLNMSGPEYMQYMINDARQQLDNSHKQQSIDEQNRLKQQSIDEQNRLQAEANRIERQKLRDISNNQESELTKTIEHIELDEQRRVLDKTNKVAREILEIEQRRLFNEQMRQ